MRAHFPEQLLVIEPTSDFASKILAFKTPLPLGISDDLPWGGYGFFLELPIVFNMGCSLTCFVVQLKMWGDGDRGWKPEEKGMGGVN